MKSQPSDDSDFCDIAESSSLRGLEYMIWRTSLNLPPHSDAFIRAMEPVTARMPEESNDAFIRAMEPVMARMLEESKSKSLLSPQHGQHMIIRRIQKWVFNVYLIFDLLRRLWRHIAKITIRD